MAAVETTNEAAAVEQPSKPGTDQEDLPTNQNTASSKKKRKKRHSKPHVLFQTTLRNPQWSYIHLQHLTSSTDALADLDAVTAHMHLTAALTQFLGLHGSAIAFDILKLETQDVWIRLAAEDQSALVAAAGGWVSGNGEGWRVKGWSLWDAGVVGMDRGQDLFTD